MIKLFVTGDIHFGKKYDRYKAIRDQLIRSRFACLERCVRKAEEEHCDFFVITGDLFDNTNTIRQGDVKKTVEILARFGGRVIVLPGNHDCYTGEEKVWKDFQKAMGAVEHNILLLTEFRPVTLDVGEETVSFYPAFCQSKHSEHNNLGWIRDCPMEDADYHIGLAHGALAGLTPDMKNEYFLMTEKELRAIPMDVWLLGHTHVPYPAELSPDRDTVGYMIFNPGTPEQTDLSNNTSGLCFVISLDRTGEKTTVAARAFQSGAIRFYDLTVPVRGDDLRESIRSAVAGLQDQAVVRLTVKGSVDEEQYREKQRIYAEELGRFLAVDQVEDGELSERITPERIRAEFPEFGFAAQLLERLTDPKEIQMAYELIRKYREE